MPLPLPLPLPLSKNSPALPCLPLCLWKQQPVSVSVFVSMALSYPLVPHVSALPQFQPLFQALRQQESWAAACLCHLSCTWVMGLPVTCRCMGQPEQGMRMCFQPEAPASCRAIQSCACLCLPVFISETGMPLHGAGVGSYKDMRIAPPLLPIPILLTDAAHNCRSQPHQPLHAGGQSQEQHAGGQPRRVHP